MRTARDVRFSSRVHREIIRVVTAVAALLELREGGRHIGDCIATEEGVHVRSAGSRNNDSINVLGHDRCMTEFSPSRILNRFRTYLRRVSCPTAGCDVGI